MTKVPLLAPVLLISLQILAQEKLTTIVFVCEHGGARSTIASVYFNKMAEENHLPYRSVFRGLTPDSLITKETANGLRSDGFDTKTLMPSLLSYKDKVSDVLLISLDCTVPTGYQPYLTWKNIPAISEDYVAARNEILKQLNKLVDDLKSKK
jgi:hypothetical protein